MKKETSKRQKKKIKEKEIILNKELLHRFVDMLTKNYETFAPVDKDKRVIWGKIKRFNEISSSYLEGKQTTVLPPKVFFFPSYEKLLIFNGNKTDYKIIKQNIKPFIIFGLHPCDIHGILLLDRVFLENYVDNFYKSRRDKAIIIGLDTMPNEWSFAKSANTDTINSGYDIFITPLKNKYYLKIATKKGLMLLKSLKNYSKPKKKDIKELSEFKIEKDKNYKRKADMHNLPELLDRTYESKIWDEIGKQCVACARCSLVCPTCYCYNVKEDYFLDLINGERVRIWDSCLRQNFALVAGGHNFRAGLKARIRHRYYHKERIFSKIYGKTSCVGCGRCSRDCKANIKPDEVFNKLRQAEINL